MTDGTPRETFTLTHAILQALLNLTSEPEAYSARMRRFVGAVHKADITTNGRWRVQLTGEDIETMESVLSEHFARYPKSEMRMTTTLCRQSDTYWALVRARLKETGGQ